MSDVAKALEALRGGFEAKPLDARRVAGMLDVPGCARRQLLDAAEVPLNDLAKLVGCPEARQSPHALGRGHTFERLVMENGMASLIAIVREQLGLDVKEVRQVDLSMQAVAARFGKADNALRARLTRQHLRAMLSGDPDAVNLIRHPMTRLNVGGTTTYLEQDVLAFAFGGTIYIIEVKSFPSIDGRPDPEKTSATARQSGVYVISVQDEVADLDHDPSAVSTEALLVCPRNFSLTPVGHVIDIGPQVRRLRRQLASQDQVEELVEALGGLDGLSLPAPPPQEASDAEKEAAAQQATDVIAALPARFGDGCISCPLFRRCRSEARSHGDIAQAGSAVSNLCGDVSTVDHALELSRGDREPQTPAERALAEQLERAAHVASQIAEAS